LDLACSGGVLLHLDIIYYYIGAAMLDNKVKMTYIIGSSKPFNSQIKEELAR